VQKAGSSQSSKERGAEVTSQTRGRHAKSAKGWQRSIDAPLLQTLMVAESRAAHELRTAW
jgi:hypothetical protein